MNVYITKERVWWTVDTEDKPSLEYFNTFESTLTLEPVRVNFKDYLNVNIVTDTDDITYVKVEHNDNTYYYFTDGIETILNNGYQYRLKLDTYSTFTLPFISNLNSQEIPVKVLRTHFKDNTYLQYQDKLLNSIPRSYFDIGYQISNKFKTIDYKGGKLHYYDYVARVPVRSGAAYDFINCNIGVWTDNSYEDWFNTGMCKYYVFSDCESMDWNGIVTPSGYLLVPEHNTGLYGTGLYKRIEGSDWSDYSFNEDGKLHTIWFSNTESNIEKLIKEQNLSTKFIGIYLLPSFLVMCLTNGYLGVRQITGSSGANKVIGIGLDDNQIKLPSMEVYQLPNITEPKLNSTEIGDIYLLNYFNIKYYDNTINVPLMNEDNTINLNGLFTFTDTGTILRKYKLLPLNNSIFKLPYQIVSTKSKYLDYVQANRNTTDTSYSIAKQNAFINGVSSIVGTATSIATGGSIVGGLGNFASSIAGGFISLSQKRQMLQAIYKDAKNTLGYEVRYSTDIDNSFILYKYKNGNEQWTEGVEVSVPSKEYLQQLNNCLYLNGYYVPKLINFKDIYNVNFNDFRYVLLDDLYLEHLLPVYVAKKVPKKHYLNIIDDLAGGVRIWDKIPEYKI